MLPEMGLAQALTSRMQGWAGACWALPVQGRNVSWCCWVRRQTGTLGIVVETAVAIADERVGVGCPQYSSAG